MKSVVIYYSNSGTTAALAKKISETFGSTLAEVKAAAPYGGYFSAVMRSGKERKKGIIAEYTAPRIDLGDVDVVFIGYPIWYSEAPLFIPDYLSKLDLNGRFVIPFSTSGASNIKGSIPKIQSAAAGARVICPYSCGKTSKDDYESWVKTVKDTIK